MSGVAGAAFGVPISQEFPPHEYGKGKEGGKERTKR